MFFKKKVTPEASAISEKSTCNQDNFASENVKKPDPTLTIESADSNRIKMDNMYGFGHR